MRIECEICGSYHDTDSLIKDLLYISKYPENCNAPYICRIASEHMSQLKERIEKNSSWGVCGNELKPCPFCECESVIAEISYLNKIFRIHCEECPAEMELSFEDAQLGNGEFISFYEMQKIITEMVEHWNRRANEPDNGC